MVAAQDSFKHLVHMAAFVFAIAFSTIGAARAQHYHVLYTFTGGTDGAYPNGLLRNSAGNLYGTTVQGGDEQNSFCYCGVVFRLDQSGAETVLYTFTGSQDGGGPDGGFPGGDLAADKAGNLYGATTQGGDPFYGVVFKLAQDGSYSVLHAFEKVGGDDPLGVVRDSGGNLYGVTASSNGGGCCGVIYRVDSRGKETVLANFDGPDGESPYGDLVGDKKGNIYGTTQTGGAGLYGVVFRLNSTGNLKVLHNFTGGADGAFPIAGLLLDGSGNAYGTAIVGGSFDNGVVFKMTRTGEFTVLHSFTGGADGGQPYGGLIQDSAGNLYGTTYSGGNVACVYSQLTGCGVVFRLDPAGNETVLYTFGGDPDGALPGAEKLVLDNSGNLYGTTISGGAGYGVVFEITR